VAGFHYGPSRCGGGTIINSLTATNLKSLLCGAGTRNDVFNFCDWILGSHRSIPLMVIGRDDCAPLTVFTDPKAGLLE
jgi:hypothetical protein